MSEVRYAACCKECGHIADKAWSPEGPVDAHSYQTNEPLTPRARVPMYCTQCGQRKWQVPATKEQVEKYDEKHRLEALVVELTKSQNFEGLFKIPEDIGKRFSPEVRVALSNLLGPLEGEVLDKARANIRTVALSGMNVESGEWISLLYRAVERAKSSGKAKVSA
jgi:hypothetical protein